jgi:hypothetical protein
MGLIGVLGGLTWPVWVVVGAVVAAGALIYKYWQPIKAFFIGVWEGIVEGFRPVYEDLKPGLDAIGAAFSWVGGKLGELWTWFKGFFGQVDYSKESLDGAKSAGKRFGEILSWLVSPIKLVWQVGKWLGEAIGNIVVKFQEWYSSSPMFKLIADGFMLLLNPIGAVIKAYEKLIELKNSWFGHEGQVDKITGSNGQGFWTIRDKMMQSGAWVQERGDDDALNMGKLESMLSSGAIKAADLTAVRAVAFDKLGTGDNLDQPFMAKLDALIAKQTAAEAVVSGPANYSTNITLNGTNVTPDQVANANKSAMQALHDKNSSAKEINQHTDP